MKKNNIYFISIIFIGVLILSISLISSDSVNSATMGERLKGRILLQVEQNGESWYVHPATQNRFYLGRPTHAFDIMRYQGLGITNSDLNKIPRAGTNEPENLDIQQRLSGFILLQVEDNGEAWYVNPADLKRYYLNRPTDAFDIMRQLGLGITDNDLNQVTIDTNSMDLITPDENQSNNESNNDSNSDTKPAPDETLPVLTKFIVDFGDYNPATSKAGDFDFTTTREKVFGDFGRTVTGPEGDKILPTFDVFVTSDTAIESPFAGEVVAVFYQESTNDYEIHMRSNKLNVWAVTLDHIVDLSAYITVGAQVTAGQYIGKPAPWSGSYLVELMIYRDVNGSSTGFCPYNFFSSSLKSTFSSNLTTLMSDWETFKGDSSIYNEAGMVKPGCLLESSGA